MTVCSAASQLTGWGLFFTPGLLAVAYSFWKGKGNFKDGFSRLLTEVSQGYLQPDVGGETIPVAQGELSDLVGGEPLFKALYQWCVSAPAFTTWTDSSRTDPALSHAMKWLCCHSVCHLHKMLSSCC